MSDYAEYNDLVICIALTLLHSGDGEGTGLLLWIRRRDIFETYRSVTAHSMILLFRVTVTGCFELRVVANLDSSCL